MCGIFGIISKKPRKFDYTTFCTLGIHNDVRGGDSCGVFIDGQVEYGVNKEKLFEDFFGNSKLIQNTTESTIAFGHCRKASIGAVNIDTAQPVVLYNDKKEIEFVVIHNGTIYNYKELARKYIPEIDIKGMTDSQVMARIFYYKGYDVLKEYNGGAVFAIADYRGKTPVIYFWQGESLVSSYGKVEEERPLYFAIAKDHITFSSIYTFLPALERDASIVCVTPNFLYRYENDDIVGIARYDRSDQKQYNTTYNSYYYNNDNYYNNRYYNSNYTTNYSQSNDYTTQNNSFGIIIGSTKNGQCFKDGKPVHGKVLTSVYGTEAGNSQKYEMWFWNGIVLNNKLCFEYLAKLSASFGVTPNDLFEVYPELVLFLSPYSFIRLPDGTIEKVDSPISSKTFSGKIQFPFTSTCYSVEDGKVRIINSSTNLDSFKLYFEHRDDKFPEVEVTKAFGEYI